MITRTITIVLRGVDESDLEDGFNEAVGRLRDGNTSGHDSNERGSFRFDCTEADVSSRLTGGLLVFSAISDGTQS